jgi:hypothetical protein
MPSPIVTPLPVQTETDYRPISKMAVTGLLLAIPSVFIFFSENLYWLMIVTIVPATILCMVALRAIRGSEGNLAGEPVALLGLVFAVGSGLGWITMTTVTKYVAEGEARAIADDWLGKLSRREFGGAYLFTKPPSARRLTFNPEEYNRLRRQFPHDQFVSDFDNFLIEPVTNLFMRYGDQVKVSFLTLIDSKIQKGETSTFRFVYRIECPASAGNFVVTANSSFSNTEDGMRRDWDVRVDPNSLRVTDTAYGSEFNYVKGKAQDNMEKVIIAIANDEPETYQKMVDSKAPGDFTQIMGFMRDKDRRGEVFGFSMQKPYRLIRDKKEGNAWTLGIECTCFLEEGSRGLDFAANAYSEDGGKTWLFRNFAFQGIRRIKPNEPKMLGGPNRPEMPPQK